MQHSRIHTGLMACAIKFVTTKPVSHPKNVSVRKEQIEGNREHVLEVKDIIVCFQLGAAYTCMVRRELTCPIVS